MSEPDTKKLKTDGSSQEGLTYASAGVSIEAGNTLVSRIKPHVARTRRPGADGTIGGFGGLFHLPSASFAPDSPTLVMAIDGVGTKLKIALEMGIHDTVGIDLVAMNVNDLVVQGAEPLAFLDYYGCSILDTDVAERFVAGVAEGCVRAGCVLSGGETAEMPGMYSGGEYDAAGAAIGAIDTRDGKKILPVKDEMKVGDVLLGLRSDGVHSNGFSLVRKIVERAGLKFSDPAPFETKEEKQSLGQALLTPTRIYVKPILAALKAAPQGSIKGLSHITGGGLLENIPRMLPSTLSASVDIASWSLPPIFQWLKSAGGVEAREMARAFNDGIGMVVVVESALAEEISQIFEKEGESVVRIGELVQRGEDEGCVLKNLESWN